MRNDQIYVLYGSDGFQMAYELMRTARIKDRLTPEMSIAIKPNLVVAKPADSGATTHPQVAAGILEYLKDNGFHNITMMEGSWIGDSTKRAFSVCGYEDLSKRYQVPLLDLKKDHPVQCKTDGEIIQVCESALKADYLINVPVLKAHCQTALTCALKNLKGCIPDSEKRRFHALGLHRPIALLNQALKSHLTVVDGLCGDLTFEEGGNPVPMNRLILGFDPVLVDAYAASLLGYEPKEIPYIPMAASLGVGSAKVSEDMVCPLNQDTYGQETFAPSRLAARLGKSVHADQACSACYGSLIHALHHLEETGGLPKDKLPLYIGQGYKQKHQNGIGIGTCTAGFSTCIQGCPPKASDIAHRLRSR